MPYRHAHAPIYGYLKGGKHTTPLHMVYYARAYSILKIINRLPFKSILNVGGADGFLNHLFQREFNANTILLDINKQYLRKANFFFKITGVCGDAHSLPFQDDSFDIVTCIETIEHVHLPQMVISELKRVAKRFVLVSTESYFEAEDQKQAFLNYIRETHPQFFRTEQPVQPVDIQHFTKQDLLDLFGTQRLHFFPQFLRKRMDIVAPIEAIRSQVRDMTEDVPISRATRIIILHDRFGMENLPAQPRYSDERLADILILDKPYFPVNYDEKMRLEDSNTLAELHLWWKKHNQIQNSHREQVVPLEIGESGSRGVSLKWMSKDNLDASPMFCVREMRIEPNGFTSHRRHHWEHQLFFFEGEARIEQDNGNEAIITRMGMNVIIPPDVGHQIINPTGRPIRFLDIIPSVTHFFGR